jgi:hypothetical protein
MALSYEQSAALMTDATFRSRIKVAVITYARYITDEASTTPAHSTRVRWAQQTLTSPDMSVEQVTPTTVMDAAVQQDGSAITDPGLQSAVENSVNKLL